MYEFIISIFTIYIFLKIYISVMQIGYVSEEAKKKAIFLSPSDYVKASKYSIKKERLNIFETLVEYALFIFWIGFGLSFLNSAINFSDESLKAVIFIDAFLLINFFISSLPFSIYKSFVLDKKFGFSNFTPKLFIIDTAKSLLLMLVFGSILVYVVSLIISSTTFWWVYAFVFIFGIIILINAIYPTLIAPMFNKFKPLEDTELNSKIEELLKSVGFSSSGVFSVDSSRRDSRLNAYFGGLGKAKRVVLFDTLIQKLSQKEILAVLGHELGHFKNGDILKNIALMSILMFSLFAFFGNLPHELFFKIGVELDSANLIAMFLLFSSALSFLFLPIFNYMSRKNEYGADRYGASLVDNKSLIDALLKLVEHNKSFPKSHILTQIFYHQHPELIERLHELGYESEK